MKQEKDDMDKLFERLAPAFEREETPRGHQERFLEKLKQREHKKKKKNVFKLISSVSAAAVIAFLVGFGLNGNLIGGSDEVSGLQAVSPEMEQAHTFFTSTITSNLETLKTYENEETSTIIDDTVARLESLEKEYNQLEEKLEISGYDKRVVNAMISNFQQRINLLQEVIMTVEGIYNQKINQYEEYI